MPGLNLKNKQNMLIKIIAAIDRQNAIGVDNQLPWSLPKDLAYFKAETKGCPVVMGYNTAKSLPFALPGRRNIVLSSKNQPAPYPGMEVYPSWEKAHAALDLSNPPVVWVIGGARVYEAFLPIADEIHLTHVDTVVSRADAFFPIWDVSGYRSENVLVIDKDERHSHAARVVRYTKPIS